MVGWIGARFPDCDFSFNRKKCECHTCSNMSQPSCKCSVLLKLAKVERLNIRKFWVNVRTINN